MVRKRKGFKSAIEGMSKILYDSHVKSNIETIITSPGNSNFNMSAISKPNLKYIGHETVFHRGSIDEYYKMPKILCYVPFNSAKRHIFSVT
jgi:hypothetical protein